MPQDMTPEEIQEALASNKRALDAGTISQEQYNRRLEELQKSTRTLSQRFDSLAAGATEFMGRLKEGKEGISAYNDYIDKGGKALGNFASAFSPVIGTMIKGATDYAKAVNKQSEALYSSYQNISRIGATGAAGITGVYDSMKKFGYGINQLGDMQGLLQDSAGTLASLSGTVADGTKNVALVSQQIRDSDIGNKFLTMGISVDNMNKGIVSYLRIQTQIGQAQTMTTEQLRKGAEAYVENADKLTKITGASLQQQLAVEQRALSEDRFGMYAARMKREGRGEDIQQVMNVIQQLSAQGPAGEQVAQGLKDLMSGSLNTEAAQTLMRSNADIVNVLRKQGVTADEITKSLMAGKEATERTLGRTYEIAGSSGFMTVAQMQAIDQAAKAGKPSERMAAAGAAQIVDDKPTKNITEFATSTRSARDSMQDLVQRGIEPVTKSMAFLADKTAKAAGIPNNLLGSSLGGSYVGKGGGGFLSGGGTGANIGGYQPPAKVTPTSGTNKEYYDKMYNTLLVEARKQGVANPEAIASLGAAQTSLETGYGKRMVGNNAFGIKARPGGGGVNAQTQEFVNGKMVTMNQQFRSYRSPEESAADYIAFLKENPRYRDVLAAKTAQEAIAAQGRTGYATDPNYANKLASINAANAGPSSGRQGVQLPDATQTVGTKTSDGDVRSNKAREMDEQHQAWLANQERLQQELIDIQRRQLSVQQKTNAKIS